MTMKLVVTYGCVSMGKHLYRTGESFELSDDEAENSWNGPMNKLLPWLGTKVALANEPEIGRIAGRRTGMELPQADAAAAVQK